MATVDATVYLVAGGETFGEGCPVFGVSLGALHRLSKWYQEMYDLAMPENLYVKEIKFRSPTGVALSPVLNFFASFINTPPSVRDSPEFAREWMTGYSHVEWFASWELGEQMGVPDFHALISWNISNIQPAIQNVMADQVQLESLWIYLMRTPFGNGIRQVVIDTIIEMIRGALQSPEGNELFLKLDEEPGRSLMTRLIGQFNSGRLLSMAILNLNL